MTRLIVFLPSFFGFLLSSLAAQSLYDPYHDTGLADRISGYADPTISWDLAVWPGNLAEYIVLNSRPGNINHIYESVGQSFLEVYREHNLSLDPESDGGRFEALQLAINSRVSEHNLALDQHAAYWSYGGLGLGVLIGVGASFVLMKKFTGRAMVGRVLGFGGLGAVCGFMLARLATGAIYEKIPEFSESNPALKEVWKDLENL